MPAKTSPQRMASSDAGEVTSRSKVRACLSHGVTRGPIAEAVKNSAIATMPGTIVPVGTDRPVAKAR